MKLDLQYEEIFDQPIDVVWRAISEPAALAQWLMESDFVGEVGRKFTFREQAIGEPKCVVESQVLELVPRERLKISWTNAESGDLTFVEIKLYPHGSGTRLTLNHTGETDSGTAGRLNVGWRSKLAGLREALGAENIAHIVHRYYDAYRTKDRALIEGLLADDITFTSPYDDAIDRTTYFERCWPNSQHIIEQTIEKIFVERSEAFVLYKCKTDNGKEFRNSEFLRLDGDKIKQISVYFGAAYSNGAFVKDE